MTNTPLEMFCIIGQRLTVEEIVIHKFTAVTDIIDHARVKYCTLNKRLQVMNVTILIDEY